MTHKSDSVYIMSNFLNYVQTQYGLKVKCFNTDNAKELCEGRILSLYYNHALNIRKVVLIHHSKMEW